MPPPRPGDAPFGVPPGPASGKPLGAAHCHPRCIENWALQAKIHRIYRFGNTIRQRKKIRRLRQGQATRLSVRRPAQRPASHWGRHTAAPDALKTGHCKQKFTEFIVLATQYDREKRLNASAKARRRAFRRIARPSVRRQGNNVSFFNFWLQHPIFHLSWWRGRRPLHRF